MSDLIRRMPAGSGFAQTRVERQAHLGVQRVRAQQAVVAAQQTAFVEIVAETTETALLATSHVAALESLLVSRTPRAEERLRHLGDAAAVGMTEIVLSTGRRCR